MNLYPSKEFLRAYKKIIKRKPSFKEKIKSKIKLFGLNPLHPSLKLHKLKGKQIDNWTISIEEDLRLIFTYVPDGIILIDIGKHEEVYQ